MASEVNQYSDRLCKRLCYVLRYGAHKEGLQVYEGGFIGLPELMALNIMRRNTEAEVLAEVAASISHRGTRRFEIKLQDGRTFIRALNHRNFEESPYHAGTHVKSLLQTTIDYVVNNLSEYDLTDFPDEHIINKMIFQLKRKKKLNARNFTSLLVPALEHLDLSCDVYVTPGILKTMWSTCTNLRVLILKDCGYIMTDAIVETLFKKLTHLESVSLTACKHITDKSLASIVKYGHNLRELNVSFIKTFSNAAILDLLCNCKKLTMLDIFDAEVNTETRALIPEVARQRGIKVVLKGLHDSDPDVTFENPSCLLPTFGKIW
ncbi:uncharacterized protein LOC127842934 [Dreissena polymorpha]|uniref:2'-phosphotransferase n=1 Tax=Dreissena polymorpha TaxID=45954 RepID=A0A9D4S168_DREPO|nr:uncharacterized protein LOC127842934 [Dreissena polymorpha]KAH3886603.1 hypothetical protein DPMN_010614 [Dreissena polymorpha]